MGFTPVFWLKSYPGESIQQLGFYKKSAMNAALRATLLFVFLCGVAVLGDENLDVGVSAVKANISGTAGAAEVTGDVADEIDVGAADVNESMTEGAADVEGEVADETDEEVTEEEGAEGDEDSTDANDDASDDGVIDDVQSVMDQFDTDKDGKISLKELQESAGTDDDTENQITDLFKKGFQKADGDSDGHLDIDELPVLFEHFKNPDEQDEI